MKLNFLKDSGRIETLGPHLHIRPGQVAIALDSSDLHRIGEIRQAVEKCSEIVNIDHHPGNTQFGHLNLIDSGKSSTVEVVYPLIDLGHIPWTAELATLVYTGILSDTGRFLFANTFYWRRPALLALGRPDFPAKINSVLAALKVCGILLFVPKYGYLASAALLSSFYLFGSTIPALKIRSIMSRRE